MREIKILQIYYNEVNTIVSHRVDISLSKAVTIMHRILVGKLPKNRVWWLIKRTVLKRCRPVLCNI